MDKIVEVISSWQLFKEWRTKQMQSLTFKNVNKCENKYENRN